MVNSCHGKSLFGCHISIFGFFRHAGTDMTVDVFSSYGRFFDYSGQSGTITVPYPCFIHSDARNAVKKGLLYSIHIRSQTRPYSHTGYHYSFIHSAELLCALNIFVNCKNNKIRQIRHNVEILLLTSAVGL